MAGRQVTDIAELRERVASYADSKRLKQLAGRVGVDVRTLWRFHTGQTKDPPSSLIDALVREVSQDSAPEKPTIRGKVVGNGPSVFVDEGESLLPNELDLTIEEARMILHNRASDDPLWGAKEAMATLDVGKSYLANNDEHAKSVYTGAIAMLNQLISMRTKRSQRGKI